MSICVAARQENYQWDLGSWRIRREREGEIKMMGG